jgi:hypothetical protein
MGNKKAPVDGGPDSLTNSTEEYDRPAWEATPICAAVAGAYLHEQGIASAHGAR